MNPVDSAYEVRLPAPMLRPYVCRYVGFCAHGLTPGVDTALPSRHAHLIISLGASIDVVRAPHGIQHGGRFRALVAGLHDAPALVHRGSSFTGLHVFLTPFGVRAILGVSGAELASRVFDLSDLWGPAADDLIDRLMDVASWRTRFAILDDVFVRALTAIEPRPSWDGRGDTSSPVTDARQSEPWRATSDGVGNT